MSGCLSRTIAWGLLATLGLLAAGPASAQDSITVARDLYSAAAYEDSLAVLNRLRGRDRSYDENRTVEQYRAFCLLALGRVGEAELAIEGIVTTDPLYYPSPTEVSPRVRSAFTDVRRRVLPSIVQQKYAQAKAAFDRKEFAAAEAGFKEVLAVLADPDVAAAATQSPLADLRTLSAGFHELSAAAGTASAAPAAAPPPPASPPPPLQPEPPASAPVPVGPRIYSVADANVVPPTTINQTMPPYPRDAFPGNRGVLEVVIDEQGRVESAAMRASVKQTYDGALVDAARQWRYTPATLDGTPVKFRKLIQITLDPRR